MLAVNLNSEIINPAPAKLRMLAAGRIWEGMIVIASACDAEPADGTLQRMIDAGAEAADYEDYLADVEFNRLGC